MQQIKPNGISIPGMNVKGNLKMILLPVRNDIPVLQLSYNDGRVGMVFLSIVLNILIGGFTCGKQFFQCRFREQKFLSELVGFFFFLLIPGITLQILQKNLFPSMFQNKQVRIILYFTQTMPGCLFR